MREGSGTLRVPDWNSQAETALFAEEKRASPEIFSGSHLFILSFNQKEDAPIGASSFYTHQRELEFSVFHCSGVRQYVTDVAYACQVHNRSFEAQTKTGVSCAAVFTQV